MSKDSSIILVIIIDDSSSDFDIDSDGGSLDSDGNVEQNNISKVPPRLLVVIKKLAHILCVFLKEV